LSKNIQSFSIVILGLCILLGSWLISQSLRSSQGLKVSTQNEQFRYEFITPNESNIIIFDKQTGEYWRKFIAPNEGPTDWEKQESPITTIE
jgi:hypothetical protein